MNISKDSWHYRLLLSHYNNQDRVPTCVCSYTRSLITLLFLLTLIGAIVIFFVFALLFFWYALLAGIEVDKDHQLFIAFFTGTVLTVIIAMAAALSCLILGLDFVTKKLRNRRTAQQTVKQDSLAVEYVRAKLDKVCPNIEFKDTKDENK